MSSVLLSGYNSYTGGTYLQSGYLYVETGCAGNPLGTGTLTVDSSCVPTPVLAAAYSCSTLPNDIVINANGLILNTSEAPKLTLTGVISDFGCYDPLTINGTVELDGANTYSGGTTINCATVTIGSDTGLGTGAVCAVGSTLNFTSCAPTLPGGGYFEDTSATFSGNPVITDLQLAESTLYFNGSSATLNDLAATAAVPGIRS